MFFDSFKKDMKNVWKNYDPEIRDAIFPNGEAEFLYVTNALRVLFKNRDIQSLISIYSAVYSFTIMERGNTMAIRLFAKRNMREYNEDEIVTMIALVMLNQTPNKNFNSNIVDQLEIIKNGIAHETLTQMGVKNHIDVFSTKDNGKVGTSDNPILVSGVSGVEKYLNNILTDSGDEIEYKRESCLYKTEPTTNIHYAVEEYHITNKRTREDLGVLIFNEYGSSICDICPNGFKFKIDNKNKNEADKKISNENIIKDKKEKSDQKEEFCVNCGNKIKSDWKFCKKCGQKIE